MARRIRSWRRSARAVIEASRIQRAAQQLAPVDHSFLTQNLRKFGALKAEATTPCGNGGLEGRLAWKPRGVGKRLPSEWKRRS